MIENRLYSEIFTDYKTCKTDEERINFLRSVPESNFKTFLKGCYDPNIQFDVELPKKYRPAPEPAGLTWSTIAKEMNKIYRFVQNHPAKPVGMSKEKQTSLFLSVLETLHKDEARLLVQMTQKKLAVPKLTSDLVLAAFPGLF